MELEPESTRLAFLPPGKVTELSWGRPFSRMHTHTFAHTSGRRKDVTHARQFKLSPFDSTQQVPGTGNNARGQGIQHVPTVGSSKLTVKFRQV